MQKKSSLIIITGGTDDELRAKMQSLDVSEPEAERLEQELDQGKIVILASSGR